MCGKLLVFGIKVRTYVSAQNRNGSERLGMTTQNTKKGPTKR
jgi:hypothetical protein